MAPLPGSKSLVRIHWLVLIVAYGAAVFRGLVQYTEAYDYWWYHLPGALRAVGYDNYRAEPWIDAVLQGFPPLPHMAQGALIWVSGRFVTSCAVNSLGLALSVGLLWSLFRERMGLRWLLTIFLAIPALNIQLGRGYVDLWCAAMVFTAFGAYLAYETRVGRPRLTLAVFCLGVTLSSLSKFTTWPMLAVLGLFWALSLASRVRAKELAKREAAVWLMTAAVGVSLWPARNVVVFGNPTYPIVSPLIDRVFGAHAEGIVVDPRSNAPLVAHQLKDELPALRFWYSVFELSRLESTDEPFKWSIDATARGLDESVHFRLGGWFFVTMATLLALYAAGLWLRLLPVTPALCVATLFLVIMNIQVSYELRYWLALPMSLALLLTTSLAAYPARVARVGKLLMLFAMIFVCDRVKTLRDFKTADLIAYVPQEIREFWRMNADRAFGSTVYEIEGKMPVTLFYTGPTLREFRVHELPPRGVFRPGVPSADVIPKSSP